MNKRFFIKILIFTITIFTFVLMIDLAQILWFNKNSISYKQEIYISIIMDVIIMSTVYFGIFFGVLSLIIKNIFFRLVSFFLITLNMVITAIGNEGLNITGIIFYKMIGGRYNG